MSTDEKVVLGRHPWRWVCPRGHHSLSVNSQSEPDRRYVCKMCQRDHRSDPYYHADDLVDKREREKNDDGTWNGL